MLTLKKVKELVEAPSHAKRTPSPKMLFEEGIVLLRREFDQGSHLTVYNSGYVLFSAGKRNTVFHIHDCQGDYAYDAAEGKGDVIEEEYFENCEWHISVLCLRVSGRWKIIRQSARMQGEVMCAFPTTHYRRTGARLLTAQSICWKRSLRMKLFMRCWLF